MNKSEFRKIFHVLVALSAMLSNHSRHRQGIIRRNLGSTLPRSGWRWGELMALLLLLDALFGAAPIVAADFVLSLTRALVLVIKFDLVLFMFTFC